MLKVGMPRVSGNERGFTLLEVMITLGILTTMILAISSLLRSSFDVRFALSQEARVTHRINVAIQKIAYDLSHAFIVSSKNLRRNPPERTWKPVFVIRRTGSSDRLSLVTLNHKALKRNAKESDSAYVVYAVKEDEKAPGRTNLYRGVLPQVPEDFKEDPPMQILARHVKAISFEPWKGDDWSKDGWDSKDKKETRDKLPHMVRMTVEVWIEDLEEGDQRGDIHDLTLKYQSVVLLPYAVSYKELKDRGKTPRY